MMVEKDRSGRFALEAAADRGMDTWEAAWGTFDGVFPSEVNHE